MQHTSLRRVQAEALESDPKSVVQEFPDVYVTNTKISYTEIGFLLGFAEPSSFFRAFRGWTGETPDSLRVSASS